MVGEIENVSHQNARPSIFIVDDNPQNLRLTRFVLESAGYAVRTAEDAEEALRMLGSYRPDLMLLDIQLPGMDGLTLVRILREDVRLQNLPVVALTAYAMRGDEDKARVAGCDGYITKPIDTRTLAATVQNYLELQSRRAAPEPTEETDDWDDIRKDFLQTAASEAAELLAGSDGQLFATTSRTVLHQWAGAGGSLGYPEVTLLAREAEVWSNAYSAENAERIRSILRLLEAVFAESAGPSASSSGSEQLSKLLPSPRTLD